MCMRTLVVGAGQAGEMVVREISRHPEISGIYSVVGFVDDDPEKDGISGIPVFHGIPEIPDLVREHRIEAVIIAIPSASSETINRIVDLVAGLCRRVKIVPGISEIIEGNVYWDQIRDIRPEDLLGREEISFEKEIIAPFFRDQVVLVTGGGGSIGSEICRQLAALPVKRIIALGHGENSIYRISQEMRGEDRFSVRIADISNTGMIRHILETEKVNTVFHAAAHKHVPLMERFPEEACRNNVFGTWSVARAAADSGVERFIQISTDKAVKPRSVMGATKRICERMILGLCGRSQTQFLVTRFGNVLGSRGSVVPLFLSQIRSGGPVTITHPRMERYFMSIREAARLVVKAATQRRGRIFVLDMGRPVLVADLADRLIRLCGYSPEEIPVKTTGLRPGEKLQEELLHEHESLDATNFEKLSISYDVSGAMPEEEREKMFRLCREAMDRYDSEGVRALLFEYAKTGGG